MPVTVKDYDTGKGLAGITVIHETHGNVRKIQTGIDGRSTLTLVPGRNYFYVLHETAHLVSSSFRGGEGGPRAFFEIGFDSAEKTARWKKWANVVSFKAVNLPPREALTRLFKLIGETNFVVPAKLSGNVTLDVKNEPFGKVYEEVLKQIKPMLMVEMRQKLTLRAFGR